MKACAGGISIVEGFAIAIKLFERLSLTAHTGGAEVQLKITGLSRQNVLFFVILLNPKYKFKRFTVKI